MRGAGLWAFSSDAGFMQVPGSGVCVATARVAGVGARYACGCGELGLVEGSGCWSGGGGVLGSFAAGVRPAVPIVDEDGSLLFWPLAPVVDVVLGC